MSITDLLNGSGGQSFKFATPGDTVTGTVVSAEVVQKKNFDSGEPEVWSDGQPVQQVKVSLQTTLRDASDPEDDGIRNVYIKGWGDQLRGLRAAIKAAGGSDLEVGGTFTVTYTGDGELAKGKRGFPPKVYTYVYVRPSATAGLISGQTEPAAPAAAPVPAAAPGFTPEQMAAFAAYQAQQAQQSA